AADQPSPRELRVEARGPRAHRRHKDEHRPRASHWSSSSTTDFGGSSTLSRSPETRTALNGSGCTVFGCANVLWAFMAAAVSTRPDARETCAPRSSPLTVRRWFGAMLDSVTSIRPYLYPEAVAPLSTRTRTSSAPV